MNQKNTMKTKQTKKDLRKTKSISPTFVQNRAQQCTDAGPKELLPAIRLQDHVLEKSRRLLQLLRLLRILALFGGFGGFLLAMKRPAPYYGFWSTLAVKPLRQLYLFVFGGMVVT